MAPTYDDAAAMEKERARRRAAAKAMLDEVRQVLHFEESFPEDKVTEKIVEADDPRDTILNVATQIRADLLVVGGRRMGAVSRMVLGSVSSHIVHHTTVPVLVVPL